MISANHVGISAHPLPMDHPGLRAAYEGLHFKPSVLKPHTLDENRNTLPDHGMQPIKLEPKPYVDPRLLPHLVRDAGIDFSARGHIADPRRLNGISHFPVITSANANWMTEQSVVDPRNRVVKTSTPRLTYSSPDLNTRLITPFMPSVTAPSHSLPYMPAGTAPYPFYQNLLTQGAFPHNIAVDHSRYHGAPNQVSSSVTAAVEKPKSTSVSVAAPTTIYKTPRISSDFTPPGPRKECPKTEAPLRKRSDTQDGTDDKSCDNSSDRTTEMSVHMPSPPPPPHPPHFNKGSMIRLANGDLKAVECLTTEDFIRSSELSEEVSISHSRLVSRQKGGKQGTMLLTFSIGDRGMEVSVETAVEHPFYVFGRGWSSCSPELTQRRYQLPCSELTLRDKCIILTENSDGSPTKKAAPPPPQRPGKRSLSPPTPSADATNKKRRWSAPDDVIAAAEDAATVTRPS